MEDRKTDPGVARWKLQQEVTNLKDALREERLSSVDLARRWSSDFNDLADRHNKMVGVADRAIRLAGILSGCLAGTATFGMIMLASIWQEGGVSMFIGMVALCVSIVLGGGAYGHVSSVLWGDEDELE